MKIDYSKLTFTELVNKIGNSRFFDLPKMLKEILSRLTPQAPPYKAYTALLSQSGTDAPVATVLENTLGGTVVWTRSDVGEYTGILAGAFTEKKTAILLNSVDATGTYESYRTDDNTITIKTIDDSPQQSDDYLNNSTLKIKIY